MLFCFQLFFAAEIKTKYLIETKVTLHRVN